ncbi:MAG: NAD(P)-dependent oxidoreductase [Luminiphilus sp.]|nr:NAD(P)-dependent oxidoreductase [Luminiphilus sp.]
MENAIITGATGLVGSAVARYLATHGVNVLCLGRQPLNSQKVTSLFGNGVTYLGLAMEEISSLPERMKELSWLPDTPTAFFHFAWQGQERLADGRFADQLNNAIYAAEAVRIAKQIECTRFINAGTLEETFVEYFLQGIDKTPYRSGQTDYALAKLASRDMCKMVAYLERIDYIHTRLSVPLAPDLFRGTYVSSTLEKIARGEAYEAPQNDQLFDIVLTDDVARAYYLIGQKGRNKADYFIGTSRPTTLRQYFEQFQQLVLGLPVQPDKPVSDKSARLFDTHALRQDTGFVTSAGFQDVVQRWSRK